MNKWILAAFFAVPTLAQASCYYTFYNSTLDEDYQEKVIEVMKSKGYQIVLPINSNSPADYELSISHRTKTFSHGSSMSFYFNKKGSTNWIIARDIEPLPGAVLGRSGPRFRAIEADLNALKSCR